MSQPRSTDPVFYQNVPRAVGAMARTYPSSYPGTVHSHPRAQLLYAESGVMKVSTKEGFWIVPPQQAVWFPPEYQHQTGTLTRLEMRTLYIRPDACPSHFPAHARIINVSPLLRELILRATTMPVEYDESGREGKIINLILEEIEWCDIPRLRSLTPRDERLQRIQAALTADPANEATVEDWAGREALSSRTLNRLIQKELGVSFRYWRDQIRALTAINLLARGESVTAVAFELGYETPSAFSAMFRKLTGVLPSRYFSRISGLTSCGAAATQTAATLE